MQQIPELIVPKNQSSRMKPADRLQSDPEHSYEINQNIFKN